jgi:hypothetical protein
MTHYHRFYGQGISWSARDMGFENPLFSRIIRAPSSSKQMGKRRAVSGLGISIFDTSSLPTELQAKTSLLSHGRDDGRLLLQGTQFRRFRKLVLNLSDADDDLAHKCVGGTVGKR